MKKILQKTIPGFLLTLLAAGVFAQQGNVAGGGDATGTGGSMSYSIGQTDYLMYSSDQGSLNLGLQHTWQISEEPPLTLEISDLVISANETFCFNALETITIAGDGDYFIVEAYGHADLIAGLSIQLKHGTSVELYGSLHARISNIWCPPQENLLASFESEPIPVNPVLENDFKTSFFKVYPNPTTGRFTLELLEPDETSNIHVELYNALGHLVLAKQLPAEKLSFFTIADRQTGIYLIRVLKDQETGTGKIIRQ
jgi:hypothetical protein